MQIKSILLKFKVNLTDSKRAQEKLDLKQEIDLQDAIKRTIKHIKFRERNI